MNSYEYQNRYRFCRNSENVPFTLMAMFLFYQRFHWTHVYGLCHSATTLSTDACLFARFECASIFSEYESIASFHEQAKEKEICQLEEMFDWKEDKIRAQLMGMTHKEKWGKSKLYALYLWCWNIIDRIIVALGTQSYSCFIT